MRRLNEELRKVNEDSRRARSALERKAKQLHDVSLLEERTASGIVEVENGRVKELAELYRGKLEQAESKLGKQLAKVWYTYRTSGI